MRQQRHIDVRLPHSAHEAHRWVIVQIAPDFELLDAWALPAEGDRGDFDSFLAVMASLNPAESDSLVSRVLFAVRYRLGSLLGWDDATKQRSIPGCGESTLSVRLPDDLRGSAKEPVIGAARSAAGGFVPLYRTDEEWAAEISNETVHGVLHLAWVDRGDGRYRGQLGVYVKPRGRLGQIYMMLIEPFRHLIVYPALMRQIERAWAARGAATSGTAPGPRSGV